MPHFTKVPGCCETHMKKKWQQLEVRPTFKPSSRLRGINTRQCTTTANANNAQQLFNAQPMLLSTSTPNLLLCNKCLKIRWKQPLKNATKIGTQIEDSRPGGH